MALIDDVNEQPLYIDYERECIACRWCEKFKRSIEVRVINQHVKTATSHKQMRQRTLHPENHPNRLQGVRDMIALLLSFVVRNRQHFFDIKMQIMCT